jgi:hypothetical protein
MRTYAAKRQILSRAHLIIVAVGAWEVLATAGAALKKNHFTAQYCPDSFHDFLYVVAAFN